ncbi:MAG: histidine--tRNA ligase [Flavipsychrobacter sp.]|jgi:histidyl-tRNA synthetase|nr:histidine--tRNA ligase [Flavipsychrobacter sp.]
MSKPSIPQGTRDFSPAEVRKRQYIFNTLRAIFELYGFQPLETPAMENLTTLTGKYGEEGDRLIFKILNNGLHEKKEEDKNKLNAEWEKVLSKPYSSPVVTERALRYDLTIPFARYVVMNQNDLAFPFRRYQMQPVWRADRPQKGRYREFWQCDCDVVGSTSLINEAELLCIYEEAFVKLGVPFIIQVNSRKILAGMAELCGHPDKLVDMTVAIDKLDKIGRAGVEGELLGKGFDKNAIDRLFVLLGEGGKPIYFSKQEQLDELKFKMNGSEIGTQGVKELEQILEYHKSISKYGGRNIDMPLGDGAMQSGINVSFSLARGLNYYTGMIVEVVALGVQMGSIGGGGRYDDLTGLFGLKNLSGVGVSFGVDRIYDVMDELQVFPDQLAAGAQAMLVNFGGENETYALSILQQLRASNIAAEIYPDAAKFDKQMKYANKRGFAYVLLPGDDERNNKKISVKNFATGEQKLMSIDDCITTLAAG